MAAIRRDSPTMLITRVRLQEITCSAISAATFRRRSITKWIAPIGVLIVPKGCSTLSRRVRMASGSESRRLWKASTAPSCSYRVMRGSLDGVH